MKQFNLDEYLENPSKKVVTRDGRNVKIHCTNCVGPHPVIAEIEGEKYSYFYDKNGGYHFRPTTSDLFFAPEKHEGWQNIYKSVDGNIRGSIVWSTKEEAKRNANTSTIDPDKFVATIKIEWEE